MAGIRAFAVVLLLQTTPIPGRWEKVDALQRGTSISILLKNTQVILGAFNSVTPDELVVDQDSGGELRLAKIDVQKVIQPRVRDRLRNGVLIGTGVGFASGFVALYAYDRALTASGYRFDSEAVAIYLQGGLIGAGIGALTGTLVDAAIKRDQVLFQARQ
jgi:hypothetical protein